MSSQTQKVESLQAPYITLCFQPPFKPSKLKQYGLPNNTDVDFYDIMDYEWEMFQNLSYEYGEDFGIRLEVTGSYDTLKKEYVSIKPI